MIYMHKQDFALNNLTRLMCHKNRPNQTRIAWDKIYYLFR